MLLCLVGILKLSEENAVQIYAMGEYGRLRGLQQGLGRRKAPLKVTVCRLSFLSTACPEHRDVCEGTGPCPCLAAVPGPSAVGLHVWPLAKAAAAV